MLREMMRRSVSLVRVIDVGVGVVVTTVADVLRCVWIVPTHRLV